MVRKGGTLGLVRLVAASYVNCSATASTLAEGASSMLGTAGSVSESDSDAAFGNEGKILSVTWGAGDMGCGEATMELDGLTTSSTVFGISMDIDTSPSVRP